MNKLRVGVLFGGKSAEHEVSIRSARSILEALDPDRFEAVPIGIDRHGSWYLDNSALELLDSPESGVPVALLPRETNGEIVGIDGHGSLGRVDVVFPVLHGPYGEDGTVQGLLELAGIPYVGSGVLGSAVGMDKDVAKRLLRDAGIAVAPFLVFKNREDALQSSEEVFENLGSAVFVKPANLGSSVGVCRADSSLEYRQAIDTAFRYDDKVIVETSIEGREIECSVLGDQEPIASLPGEIIPQGEFYTYEAKYIDEQGARLIIPANLDQTTTREVQSTAIRAFETLCCSGLSRVDMFVTADNEVIVNEINTIPGFTSISMYPKLWEVSGISYPELVSRLIDMALERHKRRSNFSTTFVTDEDQSAQS